MDRTINTEYEEQKALIQWLRIKKIFHYANVNEVSIYKQDRHYARIAESKAKAVGKLKGVADLTILLPNKMLYIEMKRKKKVLKNGKLSTSHTRTSKEQIVFLEKVNEFGYVEGRVCYGYYEAREFIEENL